MQYSTNYNMNKPELSEQYRLSHWNENTDIIDSNLKRIDDLESNIQNITDSTFKTALLNFCYPIGSIYWSGVATNPHDLFGGTWVQIKNKFIWAKGDSDTLDATGGEKTHTLTTNEMPSHAHGGATDIENQSHTHSGTTLGESNPHSHSFADFYRTVDKDGGTPVIDYAEGFTHFLGRSDLSASSTTADNTTDHTHDFTTGTASQSHTHAISSQGGGQAHNNMPPYIVKYCWQRTA